MRDKAVELVKGFGGKVDGEAVLPDGSGFLTASFPLPKDHWLLVDKFNDPPMPFKMGTDNPLRGAIVEQIKAAARYAVRASTDNGKLQDFDPDAMVQNMTIGLVGYYTPDGLSHI